jgi:polyferredoxin
MERLTTLALTLLLLIGNNGSMRKVWCRAVTSLPELAK